MARDDAGEVHLTDNVEVDLDLQQRKADAMIRVAEAQEAAAVAFRGAAVACLRVSAAMESLKALMMQNRRDRGVLLGEGDNGKTN